MIRFNQGSWFGSLFVYYGGVVPKLTIPALLYGSYCLVLYFGCSYFEISISADGSHLIAGCATFMLIFRLNQCYTRMQTGKDMMADVFSNLRTLIMSGCSYMKGSQAIVSPVASAATANIQPTEEEHKAAVLMKVHIVRLSLAFAISLKFHARLEDSLSGKQEIDREDIVLALSDLVRIKMLLTHEESMLLERICGCYEQDLRESNAAGGSSSSTYGNSAGYGSTGEEEPAQLSCLTRVLQTFIKSIKARFSDSNGDDQRYIIDFNRYHMAGASTTEHRHRMFGEKHKGHDSGGVGLPPIIIQLLRDALGKPICQSWGYVERMINFHEMILDRLMRRHEAISQLVSMPLPLPYLQHSKGLLVIFACSYPLTIDWKNGLWGNVVVPTFLVMALLGFEIVADMLENPVGDDACDLNYYEMIHNLEVEAKTIFDLSENSRGEVEKSWQDLGSAIGLTSKEDVDKDRKKLAARPKYTFDCFFEWMRLPKHTIKYVIVQQSRMETVQESYFLYNPGSDDDTWRQTLAKFIGWSNVKLPKRNNRSRLRYSTVELKALAEDVFLLTHHVALKSFNLHGEVSRKQMDMLDFLAWSDDDSSIQERLNSIHLPQGMREQENEYSNASQPNRHFESK